VDLQQWIETGKSLGISEEESTRSFNAYKWRRQLYDPDIARSKSTKTRTYKTAKRNVEVCNLYLQGELTQKEIAESLGVTFQRVGQILREQGISAETLRNRKKEEMFPIIEQQLKSGSRVKDIAEQLGVHPHYMTKLLKEAGLKRPSIHEVRDEKVCPTCKIAKPMSEFSTQKYRDGIRVPSASCKPCARATTRRWYQQNKDRAKQANKAWAEANPDKIRAYGKAQNERKKAQKQA